MGEEKAILETQQYKFEQIWIIHLREVIMQSCVCRPLWMELGQRYVISQEDNSPLTLYIDFQNF